MIYAVFSRSGSGKEFVPHNDKRYTNEYLAQAELNRCKKIDSEIWGSESYEYKVMEVKD